MFPNGMIPKCSMYIFPNGMIWKEGSLAVFGGYHGLGRSAGEGVERQAPSPGKIAVARAPRRETPPAALLTGGVSGLAPPRWADGIPGGPRSLVLARGGRFRPPLTAIRLCTPLFRPATPLAGFLAASPFDVRKYTRHRDNAVTFLV